MEKIKENDYLNTPLTMDIILYKNNYIDNLIISELKKNLHIFTIGEPDVFIVNAQEFKYLINKKFKDNIERIKNASNDEMTSSVNSAYFLSNILNNYPKLQSVKVIISNKTNFSRIVEKKELGPMIIFDFKFSTGSFDCHKYFDEDEIPLLIELLNIWGFIDNNRVSDYPFIKVKTMDIFNKISEFENEYPDLLEDFTPIIDVLFENIEYKLEEDNALLYFKLDYETK